MRILVWLMQWFPAPRGCHPVLSAAPRSFAPGIPFPLARIRSYWQRLCRRFYGRRWFRRYVFWRI